MTTLQLQSLKLDFSFYKNGEKVSKVVSETNQVDTILKVELSYFNNGVLCTQRFSIANEHCMYGKTYKRGIIYCLTVLFYYLGSQQYLFPTFGKDLEVNNEYAKLILTNLDHYKKMGFSNSKGTFLSTSKFKLPYAKGLKQLTEVLEKLYSDKVFQCFKNLTENTNLTLTTNDIVNIKEHMKQNSLQVDFISFLKEIGENSNQYLSDYKKLSDIKAMLEAEQDIQLFLFAESANVSSEIRENFCLNLESYDCYQVLTTHLVNREYHYSKMLEDLKVNAKSNGKHYKKVLYLPLPESEQHSVNIAKFSIDFMEWLQNNPNVRVVIYTKNLDIVRNVKLIGDKLGINYTNILIKENKNNELQHLYNENELICEEFNKSIELLHEYLNKS